MSERGSRGGPTRGGNRGRRAVKKKQQQDSGGFSIATPFEWFVNTLSRPGYMVGSAISGDIGGIAKNALALTTLGVSEKIPGLDAPEISPSQGLEKVGVDYPDGLPGFLMRFGTDVALSPDSYISFGTSGAIKSATRLAAQTATEKAIAEAVARGATRRQAKTLGRALGEAAETEVKRSMPRQFSVGLAPPLVTLGRRGVPIATKDIVLENSAVGRQLDKIFNAFTRSKPSAAAQRAFATAGDPELESRVVDAIVRTVRQQADVRKRSIAKRVLRPQAKAFDDIVRNNDLNREDATRSVGAWLHARADADLLGVSPAAAYANYVRNVSDNLGAKAPKYLAFDTVEKVLQPQIKFWEQVAKSTAKSDVQYGAKTADDIIDNYFPRIPRKGKDAEKVDRIEGWTGDVPTTALRSSTTQKSRVLRTSEDWFKNGLIPEDDFFRVADWRLRQSVDLAAQQTALDAVASKYGRVLDENYVLGKVAQKASKAAEKYQQAAGVVAKANESLGKNDAEVVQRNLALQEAADARRAAEEVAGRTVNQAEGARNVVRGVQTENPLPTVAQAGAAAAARAEGPSFADLSAMAQEGFNARQFYVMARNELLRRRQEVEAGLDNAAVLAPYERLVARAEKAVKDAPKSNAGEALRATEAASLRAEAINLLKGERAARRADLLRANEAVRQARRSGNKVQIERAKGAVREAKFRLKMATERQQAARMNVKGAERRLENRARILGDRTDELRQATRQAERTVKTPGARATPEEMADFKKAGWQQLQYDYDSVVAIVPPEVRVGVDRAFKKAWDITTKQSEFASARRFVQGATSRWKGLALLSVGYHMRNLMSDLTMSYIAGAKDPRSLVYAVQALRGRSGSIVIKGKRYTYADIVRMARDDGAIEIGEVTQDAGKIAEEASRTGRRAVWNKPRKPGEGVVSQSSMKAGQFREDSTRLMLYIERLKAGDTGQEAARVVREYLFDYGDVSAFVKSTRRFLFPFITWSAKALPRIVIHSVQNPRSIVRMGYAMDAANESFGPIDVNNLPLGRTMSFAIPTLGLGSGTYTFNPENTLPQGVLNSFNPFGFKNAGRAAGSFLNPALKVPIELATGYNLYQGRTAPRRVQAPIWIKALSGSGINPPFLDIGDKQDLYSKEKVTGYSRAWDSVFRSFPPYQLAQAYPGVGAETDRISYLRSMLGVNISPYERQRDLFYAQRFAPSK